jgi:segregation and condensation protein B
MSTAAKEREKQAKMKALRKELDREIQDQLEENGVLETLVDPSRYRVESLREEDLKDPASAKKVVEALIFASPKPLTPAEIRKVTKVLTAAQIDQIVTELKEEYKQQGRPFEIVEIAGGYELSTKKEFAPWILRIELQRKARQATQSALETLAILAYRQPLTRAEIEALRGVDVSGVVSTLMEKGFIRIVGKKEVPGRPFLYGTTEKFLEHFGLKSLQELPSLSEIQQMVESSVKKEQLIGTTRIVDVPQEGVSQEGASRDASESAPAHGEISPEEASESDPGVENAAPVDNNDEATKDHGSDAPAQEN